MKNKLLKLFGTILVAFLFITNVSATPVAEAGQNYTQEGEYKSSRFVAGNSLTNKATIDGLSFAAGNTVFGYGNLTYAFYAGNVLNLNDKVSKDLFAAGNNITIGPEAVIERDAYIAGSSIIINANIGRDLRAASDYISLKGITIEGDAIIDASTIDLDENTVITGKLSYPSNAKIANIDKASIGNIEVNEVVDVDTTELNRSLTISLFIYSILAGIVTLLILLAVLPGLREKIDKVKLNSSDIAKTSVLGLVLLVMIPVVSIFAIFTGLLTPITSIVLAIYFICLYLAPLFASYYVGYIINSKLFKLKKTYLLLSIFIGVVLVKLIGLIPFIGEIVSFLVLIYGFGLLFTLIKANISKK